MNLKTFLLAAALAAIASPAHALDPATSGAIGVPANRIVGLWSTLGMVGPCGGTVTPQTIRNTLLFQAGGTVIENPRSPPQGGPGPGGGVHQRSIALGTWSYNPVTQQYTMHLQFDWFADNVWHGYSTVDRTLLLNGNGSLAAGPVRSTRFAANGAIVAEVCGSATSTRL
jgi:hypothetical protein